jgi:hypothetical protein
MQRGELWVVDPMTASGKAAMTTFSFHSAIRPKPSIDPLIQPFAPSRYGPGYIRGPDSCHCAAKRMSSGMDLRASFFRILAL